MSSHKKIGKIIKKVDAALSEEVKNAQHEGSIINNESYGAPVDAITLAQERCLRRYGESRRKYNAYFLKCLDDIEALQPSAFAGVQVSRMFTVGVLPKYCKIKDPLSPKQRERVEQIIQG